MSYWYHLVQGTHLVMQKPQEWFSSKARNATARQRHVECCATMEMGRNCGFCDEEMTDARIGVPRDHADFR